MEIYYLSTNYDILRIIEHINDKNMTETKYNKYGEIKEGLTGRLIREYIGKIGIDNIYKCINNIDSQVTNKKLKNEFDKILNNDQ